MAAPTADSAFDREFRVVMARVGARIKDNIDMQSFI